MIRRYVLASFLGGMTGAGCVLVIIYVTNAKALIIHDAGLEPAVNALHSRINDFYIFAGIVITLLLAINVGVFVKADEEVDRQITSSIGGHLVRIKQLLDECEDLRDELADRIEAQKNKRTTYESNPDFDSQL